ncbi:MAG: peptidylprolyl isomerase [Acidimicrobiia bacterium]
MKKLLSGAVVAALLLTACGGGAVAATVGQTELTVDQVQAFPYSTDGAIPADQFARYLGALIQWQILDDAAKTEFDIDPTSDEVDSELNDLLAAQAGGLPVDQVAQQQNVSVDILHRLARVSLIQKLIVDQFAQQAPEPTSAEVAQAMSDAADGLTNICVRHLLVDTEEAAKEAKQRIEEGEDFATVAKDVSTDPTVADNGGDLGCAQAQKYVPEFAQAAVGADLNTVIGPVQSQFGYHVLEVYDRTPPDPTDLPTEDEIKDQLRQEKGASQLQDWLVEKVDNADVTVNAEYGTWTTDPTPQVQPPTS